MDHSLHSYLQKRSSGELTLLLEQYAQQDLLESYYYAVAEIIDILQARNAIIPHRILQQISEIQNSCEETS